MDTSALPKWPAWVARTTAALIFLMGLEVLAGWMFDIAVLKQVRSDWVKMAPDTALCFVTAGMALWCAAAAGARPKFNFPWAQAARICAAVVAVIGLLKLSEYMVGWHLGFDHLFLFQEPPDEPRPASMASATAFDFALAGIALLLAGTSRFGLFQVPVFLGGFVGWLGVSHYLFGGEPLLHFSYIMAPHSSLGFVLLNIGVLCLRTDAGLMALLVSDSAGGQIARRLVPAALAIPIALGWLCLEGQRARHFGTEAGVSLFALLNVLLFGGLIWANAARLHLADRERRRAEARLKTQLARLDLLNQITRAIGEHQDLQSIYQVVIRSLEDHLPIDFGCVGLYDDAKNLVTVVRVGARSESLAAELALPESSRISIDQNGLGRAVQGHLVYEPDVSQIPFPFPERLARGGLRSVVIAPLLVDDQVIGVLVVARRETDAFSSSDCEFLRQLSEHTALAAHQAQLHHALQNAYDDLRRTQLAVMQQERLRALGEMASGIAHDINNGLSPVMLYTGLMLEKETHLSAASRGYLETIQRALVDVTETIGRLREFYRPREPLSRLKPVLLNDLVRHVVELTRARWKDMAQQQGIVIQLQLDVQPGLPPFAGVEGEIREALTNLVFNAVDAMPKGGLLTLRTKSLGKEICVEVADNGVGMNGETRRRCLEPFFTTKGERGTGLGLAMVYGIVQRHNASLEIESEPGRGTTVRIIFPEAVSVTAGAARATGPVAVPATAAPPPHLRLLVVDDDPLLLKSLHDILEADGHTVVTANGGQAGIGAFQASLERQEPFTAVITDLGMPHVDGRAVASAVKLASPATPVILLTGWGKRLIAEGEVPPHVNLVLSKPPKPSQLRDALARCLQPPESASPKQFTRANTDAPG